ncbi:MAG: biopolymer transporter ExbD [Planctomycetota bacterium]|nr:MAG: biopolymer transporter ExbD [Planctomycetota bacterium]REJ95590.1 MAG: biopolymer transporter ExbD [Planctomycetota bacterium]REK22632.1 MAG: biopolymer transporter ExbD [Planctomycetota bacterium]REK48801.1 MAG: biopolymer transporter ExbD [Planctomycetota bacterium]
MRPGAYGRRGGVQPNMTPMIDVVFLLIIFFLVSSHLARQEVQADVSLPTATSGEEDPQSSRKRVTIHLVADGEDYEIRLGSLPIQIEELPDLLAAEIERASEPLEVRIRGDRTVPYQYVSPVLAACAREGIWNVTFAVLRRENGS